MTVYNPAATADDGYELFGTWTTGSIRLGANSGTNEHPGIRVTNVTIAQGATIASATLGLYAGAVNGTGGAGTIYGRAADNAGQFSTGASLPSAVTKTTASTAVSAVATTGQKTWDVTAIVQEIVNRAGWASGNAMAFPIIGTGSGANDVQFNDYASGSNIPYLDVTVSVAGQPTTIRFNGIPGMRLGNQSFGRGW